MQLQNEQSYNTAMERIEVLMKKGEGNLTEQEEEELISLAIAAEEYEEANIYKASEPKAVEGLKELEMYRNKLKQNG